MSESKQPLPIEHEVTQAVYDFIREYCEEHHGLSPSQREIAEHCFISKGNVPRHLDRLVMLGWIERKEGQARSIRLKTVK